MIDRDVNSDLLASFSYTERMEFKQHPHPELKIVQVISPEVIVHDEQDAQYFF